MAYEFLHQWFTDYPVSTTMIGVILLGLPWAILIFRGGHFRKSVSMRYFVLLLCLQFLWAAFSVYEIHFIEVDTSYTATKLDDIVFILLIFLTALVPIDFAKKKEEKDDH